MTIAAGRLRHWVTIQRKEYAVDSNGDVLQNLATGETEYEWVDQVSVWAAIEPSSAREFIASQAVQSQVTGKIIIRYRAGLLPTDRIVHKGRIFQIEGILTDKDSGIEYMTLPVSDGVNDGQ